MAGFNGQQVLMIALIALGVVILTNKVTTLRRLVS
jgi:hypothetical protein